MTSTKKTNGILLFAKNNKDFNYIKQAQVSAMLAKHYLNVPVAIVTSVDECSEDLSMFDVVIDWKGIGSHATRIPAEMDMIFIPNFNSDIGKKLILENENKFVSLMLMFGQISLLKIISNKNNFKSSERLNTLEDLFFD